MIATRILRYSRPALAIAVATLWAGACDDTRPPSEPDPTSPENEVSSLSSLIVSNPVSSATGGNLGLFVNESSNDIVYISLPPGSVPNGERVFIRARGTGAEATTVMVDGGFDPIPIAAMAGETLDLRIDLEGGEREEFVAEAPGRRPPVVVRTDPPPQRRDVPLNAVMLVVFSEPISAASLAASSVQLLLGGAPVDGTLGFGDGAHLTATFTPDEPLTPGAEYTLLVTQAIQDLDGDELEEPVTATFTAVSTPVSVQAVIGWDPSTFEFSLYYSYRWWAGPEPFSGDCRMNECPARRLTVSRISEPTAIVWEIVDTSGDGFEGVIDGNVPPGAVATVDVERVGPTTESVLYRVSVTLLDGRVGSIEFDSGVTSVEPPPSGGNISGVVSGVTATGVSPLEGARVTFFGYHDESGSGRYLGDAFTDSEGRYSFPASGSVNVFASDLDLRFRKPCVNFGDGTQDIVLYSEDVFRSDDVQPPADASPMVSGVVYEDVDGELIPLPGITVYLDLFYDMGDIGATALTNSNGEYFLCRIPTGAPALVIPGIQATGPGGDIFQSDVIAAEDQELDIIFRR